MSYRNMNYWAMESAVQRALPSAEEYPTGHSVHFALPMEE
jgi:hypothetical protein